MIVTGLFSFIIDIAMLVFVIKLHGALKQTNEQFTQLKQGINVMSQNQIAECQKIDAVNQTIQEINQ